VVKTKEDLYRAIVIGCGQIGSSFANSTHIPGVHSHAQAYHKHPRVNLVGVADTNTEKLNPALRLWNVEGGSNAIALCRQLKPDIVSICTPNETHFPIAYNLLQESPPRILFIEKPIALASSQAAQLLELAKEQNCAIAVNYSRRFSPTFRLLKQEIDEGKHGQPLLARILYGKGLLHNGSHALDLVRFWFGEPIEYQGVPAAWGPEGDETYNVDLLLANNCRVRLEAFDERVASVFEMDFLATKTRVQFWFGGHEWKLWEVQASPFYSGYYEYVSTERQQSDGAFHNPMGDCLWLAVENIVSFLDGEEPLLCTGDDGFAVLSLIEKIRASGKP